MEAEIPLGAPVPITLNETVPVTFKWTDHLGGQHASVPRIHDGKLILPDTGEASSPFFHFPAAQMVGSGETAERFSGLSKANKHRKFVKIFTREYPWIKDLNVEVNAGAPALYATLKGNDRRVPVANVSGGINRMLGIMLAISTEKHSIVLVDEVENGIYFSHLPSVWRSILALLREYDSQMFVTTHSMECLEALVTASGDTTSDIALWRTDRQDSEIKVSRLRGDVLRAAVEYGEEIR
jgi:hypothetical protein